MRFTLHASDLRRFIGIPANIVSVATFRADADGITMDAVDDARVMMALVRVPASSMLAYEGPQNFTVDISAMLRVLSLAESDDTVTVSLEQDGRLALRFGTITRLMGTEPTEQAAMRIPDIPYTAHIGMPASMVREAVRATADIGDAVTLVSDGGRVYMESQRDMDSARYDAVPTELDGA